MNVESIAARVSDGFERLQYVHVAQDQLWAADGFILGVVPNDTNAPNGTFIHHAELTSFRKGITPLRPVTQQDLDQLSLGAMPDLNVVVPTNTEPVFSLDARALADAANQIGSDGRVSLLGLGGGMVEVSGYRQNTEEKTVVQGESCEPGFTLCLNTRLLLDLAKAISDPVEVGKHRKHTYPVTVSADPRYALKYSTKVTTPGPGWGVLMLLA